MSSSSSLSSVAAMEGRGAYNRSAIMQAAGGATAVPFLVEAAGRVDISGRSPLVIADYGSSQGKNSLAPLSAAISALRARVELERSISVVHVDQSDNDFQTLFKLLEQDPDSYLLGQPAVFPCAVGRSFYQPVLPPGSVALGWCANAAHWLSRVPCPLPDAWHRNVSRDVTAIQAFERQAAADWRTFLSARADELRPNGRLIVYLMTSSDDGSFGWDLIAWSFEVLRQKFLQTELAARFPRATPVFPTIVRSRHDLLAPFEAGLIPGLELEHFDTAMAPDPVWEDYARDGNDVAFGRRWAAMLRALATSLASAFPAHEQSTFLDWFEDEAGRLLATDPKPMNMWYARLVCRCVRTDQAL